MTNVNENSRLNLNILKQYIKDLSYENPLSFDLMQSQQNLNNVSVDMTALFHPYKKDVFGVSLKIVCHLSLEKNNVFHLELDYSGLFKIMNIEIYNQDDLTSEAVRLLFPFARSIIAQITLNGGSLPIFLDNIDFGTLQKSPI
jgi:preprotein translocase subunit SecB